MFGLPLPLLGCVQGAVAPLTGERNRVGVRRPRFMCTLWSGRGGVIVIPYRWLFAMHLEGFFMASMSDYLERKLLDHTLGTTAYTFPSTVYLSLHTADPTDVTATALSTEVVGGSYGRQIIEFVAATGVSGLTDNEIACVCSLICRM